MRQRRRIGFGWVVASVLLLALAAPRADAHAEPDKPWSLRVALGAGFIEYSGARADGAYEDKLSVGMGGAVDLLWHWTAHWRLGVGYALERYAWSGYGTAWLDDQGRTLDMPHFPDEWLLEQRLLLLLRWEPLAELPVSPFVMLGLGVKREDASVRSAQCFPADGFGPAAEVAAGLDVRIHDGLRLGLDWRVATPVLLPGSCNAAYISGDPPSPPGGLRHRALLALTFDGLF